MCLRDNALVGLRVGIHLTETGEVAIFQQSACRFVHALEIDVAIELPTVSPAEGVLPEMYEIVVRPERGAEAGMHVVSHGPHLLNGDVRGKNLVELVRQLGAIQRDGTDLVL